MKRSQHRSLVLCLLFTVAWVGCQGKSPGGPPEIDHGPALDALLGAAATADTPGVAVAVVRRGEVVYRGGFGSASLDRRTPITTATQFRLASVSKHLFATLTLLMAREGLLNLDDPVSRYVPEVSRYGEGLTIRHLMQHTGGLPDYYEATQLFPEGTRPTNEDVVTLLGTWGQPVFAPGEKWQYSNPGYDLLATLLGRAGGKPVRELLAERIFIPLKMANSVAYDESEPPLANRALGYRRTAGGFELYDDDPLNYILGSGGIYSTVDDLSRWVIALDAGSVVSPEAMDKILEPTRLNSGEEVRYGLGWRLGEDFALGPKVAHAGGWVGFSTYLLRYPRESTSIIVLSNLEDFDAEGFAHRIRNELFPPPPMSIVGAQVVDGSGQPGRLATVRIVGDSIAAVGDFDPEPGDLVIDGSDRVLAPGFIDTHSHADSQIFAYPDAEAAVSQGITTVVVGIDGGSIFPLRDFFSHLDVAPSAVNVISFGGHNTYRSRVMGDDFRRPASAEEIAQMISLLREDLAAGAWGLSTGLEYDPGIFSATSEVITLASEAAVAGGRYTSHLRSEDRRFWQAIEEIVEIGRQAEIPVNITHIKLALLTLHGRADELIARLYEGRSGGVELTADIYPYEYWQSTLEVMFPERNFEDLDEARYVVTELADPAEMLIPVFAPEPSLAGMTLAEIAALRQTEPAVTLIDLIREAQEYKKSHPDTEEDVESVIARSMREEDIAVLLHWPFINVSTDGSLAGSHPRGYGSFPRVLRRYVRELDVLSLEEAVYKMTAAAAANLGLADRGLVAPGMRADLVLFDPLVVADRATLAEPNLIADGIEMVWVNGLPVWEGKNGSGQRPGRALRRPGS